ncbi:MAG: HAD-IA family hydrolase, partial [Verrucomicrobia bacterium]|nr:HAD-IA family hydrolase [Verrucomicrobiota bacterium]
SDLAFDEIHHVFDYTPLLCRYETGSIGTPEFFAEVCAATGYRGTLAEFSRAFADIFTVIESSVELNRALRRRGIPTFVLSNTSELHIGHIREKFPFYAEFDGCVLSYEVGAMKPDEKIYLAAEKLTGKRGAEILFLDDRAANTAAAAARGWQVIRHETPEATRAVFEKLGLL